MIDKIPDPPVMNHDRDGAPGESAMTRRQFLTFLGRGAVGLCALTGVCAAAGGSLLRAAATSDTLSQVPAVAKDNPYIADARYRSPSGRTGECVAACALSNAWSRPAEGAIAAYARTGTAHTRPSSITARCP